MSNAGTNDAVIADAVLIKSITPPPNTPEITVRTASVIIDDGTSLSFAAVTQGDASSQDFIVRNDGTADLILQPITVGGSAFSLGSPNFTVNQVLAPGNEVTFTIDVNTATAGTFNGSVSLASDDADESPFDLTLAAIVHPPGATEFLIDDGEPGFALTGNWNNVPSFGYQADAKVITANLSGTATWTFTGLTASLFNVSTTWLHGSDRATSVSYVVRDGVGGTVLATVPVSQKSAPAGMVIGGRPFASLADVTLTTDTLVVELTNAGTDGAVIADAVRIESFVPPSNSPEITVTQDAATVVDDGSFSFGSAEQNDPQLTKTFVVTNTGTANLILEPITVTGTGFTLTSANFTPGQTLIPNATASLTVGLATATLGTFNGTVSLANNDGDENPFNFDISGSINVAQPPGIEIKDNGDSGFSATGDWLDVSGYGYALDALAGNDTNGTDTAKWVFDSLTPGDYEVSATWLRAGDRDTNVSYVIRDGDGGPILGTVVVDQTQNAVGTVYGGRPFEVLNVFTISGTTLVVELSTLGTTKAVIADAVRIEMQ